MLLAVDTSTRYAGVALYDATQAGAGRVLASHSWYSAVNHTAELMPAVSQILEHHGLAVDDLTALAVALGPGGFSALRVGLSVVKGLAAAASKPLVGVGTLDLEAHSYLDSGLRVCAVLDAGRDEVASALFATDGRRTRDDMICPGEELVDSFEGKSEGNTLFCGEGMINWGGLIRERLGSNGLVVAPQACSRLWSLCEVSWKRLEEGEISDLSTLQPTYLRMPSIGGPKRRDRRPQGS